MILSSVLVLVFLRISCISAAPLQLHFLTPYERLVMQQQQPNIQQQLLELQALQQLSSMSASMALNNPSPPLLFFLPDHQTLPNTNDNEISMNDIIDKETKLKQNAKLKDGDIDSVVVDAEPTPVLEEQKAFLVLPNGRFSIGGLISAIPFLPIEINVPDTISWAYNGIANGISSIISIIGQRPPINSGTEEVSLKSLINNLKMRKEQQNVVRPVVIIPLQNFKTPILPIQL